MAHLITTLLFIGFFSSAFRVKVSADNKPNEHFISFRDYDFVGEDPRLKAALAERMKVLQGEVDLSDLNMEGTPVRSDMHRPPPVYKSKPEYLHSSLNFPQMDNDSLNNAYELYNATVLFPEMNGQRRDTNPFPGKGGRRQEHHDPDSKAYNDKALELMKQLIYGTQLKMLELDPVVKKYQTDPRFRIAYIYNRLDEWLHLMRNAYRSMVTRNRRVKRLIWYYEHALRINIDITYSIEHVVFLHNEYMKNMEALVPISKRKEIKNKKLEKDKESAKKKGRK